MIIQHSTSSILHVQNIFDLLSNIVIISSSKHYQLCMILHGFFENIYLYFHALFEKYLQFFCEYILRILKILLTYLS
jgi:hypothetical protein